MADRSRQPAVLLRRIEKLELLLAAEQQAHAKTFEAYRETLYKLVTLKLRNGRALAVLEGRDEP